MAKTIFIDLSVTIVNNPPGSFIQSEITYHSHEESAKGRGKAMNLPEDFFPESRFAAEEVAKISTHAGTHLDAPWHYGPSSEGRRAKKIDELPLEWCYGNGVVLDLSYKNAGELITAKDVQEALDKIKYKLKPFDIVLIRTDASRHYGQPGYENMHPGMGRESTMWLIEQGIKVMGIDAFGWDRPFGVMMKEYESGAKDVFWAGHYAGKEKEYCHLENLANLHQIPIPYGFKIAVFPVKIKGSSAGWVRAVAIID
jgi:kynurenine formamidase